MIKTHTTTKGIKYRIISTLALAAFTILFPMQAVTSAASQDFFATSGSNVQQGMLVSLSSTAGFILPSTSANSKLLVGVVAPPDDTPLTMQPGQINVRTDGTAEALVSTLNGSISIGDRISASSITGIGEKLYGNGWIVGTAQASLSPSTSGAIETTVTGENGQKDSIYVGTIPVLVKVSYYTASATGTGISNSVPSSIQNAANTIAGKHASLTALIFSFAVALIAIILGGFIVNSAVRGGMLAIARQPLTRRVIGKNVLRSFGMAAVIMVAGVFAALILLRFL